MTIQVFKPSMGQEEIDAVAEVIRSGWIGLGPKTAEFERQFAEYVGAQYAVGVNSATAGLHLAYHALGISRGDEVLVPTITFVSTAHAVIYCGATPVFVDIEADTLNIDVEDVASKITPRTAAIVPIHYGGHACRMDEIHDLAEERNLLVIEDTAHACGSKYRGKRIGGLEGTGASIFSFHAVKNLATCDGGMITTDSLRLTETLRQLRWCGIDKSTWKRTGTAKKERYSWYYEVSSLGFKCHMNDIVAALGLVQLSKLERLNARRREIVERYNAELSGLDWLTIPVEKDYTESALHNYVIKTPRRDELNSYLKERGIATGVHYTPIHLQPYYFRIRREPLPVAEAVWKRLLTLPLFPDLTNLEVQYIIEQVRSFGDDSRQVGLSPFTP